ncbi:hypothetical protein BJ980_001981 [Nocardioides daedukensis]|uniref:Uncharacterized protein n=1 Tax=Nocardioides daedukensis TaxID=634462 RepID=A0A7Y9S2W0_9ACTN|nr:hypothetical protein [Nocardioides daedukensis]NYG59058.1 hypothetical protein [Nocardioides daedukensis]
MKDANRLACAAVLTLALSACSNTGIDVATPATDPTTGQSQPTSTSAPVEQPHDPIIVEGAFGIGLSTLSELAEFGTVFIGTVTSEEDGDDGSVTDPYVHDRQLRRLVTIRVDRVLAGDDALRVVTTRTLGWHIETDGERQEMVQDGKPWLSVGDKVLFAAAPEPGTSYHYTAGADGAFVFRDGTLQAPPGGHISPILKRLQGLSEEEIARAIEEAAK